LSLSAVIGLDHDAIPSWAPANQLADLTTKAATHIAGRTAMTTGAILVGVVQLMQ
jgi:hypothetical protein